MSLLASTFFTQVLELSVDRAKNMRYDKKLRSANPFQSTFKKSKLSESECKLQFFADLFKGCFWSPGEKSPVLKVQLPLGQEPVIGAQNTKPLITRPG